MAKQFGVSEEALAGLWDPETHRFPPDKKACFAATRSELVVPIRRGREIVGVIDVESDPEAAFGEEDRDLAERVAALLAPFLAAPAFRTGEPDLTA